ncbi:unnamed protein product [Rotaria sordida]|uniref:JmjC domain-containing protein n=1 Tax=Rotaria sordida TaxID=392033 RepID=A0A815L1C1_9BILA|nr:unnamed protein product [Rotaria sordida]CAF1400482.1 unnamed protein product [Rotaria sordida]
MYEYFIFIILIIFISNVSTINNIDDIYSLETCNIPEEFSYITQDEFDIRYGGDEKNFSRPVVFRQIPMNKQFLNMIQLDSILHRYGNKYITVTTANTYSYQKEYIKLNDYINLQKKLSKTTQWGNETLYWFGDDLLNDQKWLNEILQYYKSPSYSVGDFIHPSLSFGIGGQGTGVPFHFHGPGFQQIIFGRKRWYLSLEKPLFDPNETTIQWSIEKRFTYKQPFIYECTLYPGDIIFFPNLWWHATLNLDFSIFLSTFLSL